MNRESPEYKWMENRADNAVKRNKRLMYERGKERRNHKKFFIELKEVISARKSTHQLSIVNPDITDGEHIATLGMLREVETIEDLMCGLLYKYQIINWSTLNKEDE